MNNITQEMKDNLYQELNLWVNEDVVPQKMKVKPLTQLVSSQPDSNEIITPIVDFYKRIANIFLFDLKTGLNKETLTENDWKGYCNGTKKVDFIIGEDGVYHVFPDIDEQGFRGFKHLKNDIDSEKHAEWLKSYKTLSSKPKSQLPELVSIVRGVIIGDTINFDKENLNENQIGYLNGTKPLGTIKENDDSLNVYLDVGEQGLKGLKYSKN